MRYIFDEVESEEGANCTRCLLSEDVGQMITRV